MQDPENIQTIKEVTTAIFSAQAPRYVDFFPEKRLNPLAINRGHDIYKTQCARCHGDYTGSSQTGFKLTYFPETPVMDVGTQSRYQLMDYAQKELSRLSFYKSQKFKISPQKGYIPQPLDGVWIRYPYLHNGSVPDLCSLLTHSSRRPKQFFMGEAFNKEKDFDHGCVGYPQGIKTPSTWISPTYVYDTELPGHSSQGHNYGVELPIDAKLDLIEFLKSI
jgi:hypothetical protein